MSSSKTISNPITVAKPAPVAESIISPQLEANQDSVDKTGLPSIQCKFMVGAADDPMEREADAMANKVIRMPEQKFIQRKCSHCEKEERIQQKPLTSFIQRQCSQCEEEEKVQRKPITSFIQRKESGTATIASETISQQIQSTKGSGISMNEGTMSFMQERFRTDFSNIKIHTDSIAIQMNRDLQAKAFAVGNDIYFNEGQYRPGSEDGNHLLAHELTHTIQQGGAKQSGTDHLQLQRHTDRRATPTEILHTLPHSSPSYRRVITRWPNNNSIWDVLTTREAKINFIHFILAFDKTNCILYDSNDHNDGEVCSRMESAVHSFKNLCQGYAAQMYARYTSEGRMNTAAEAGLRSEAFVVVGNVPRKFHIPIKIVTVPGHAFNSVLIGQDPQNPNDWLFFEPQDDEIFFNADDALTQEVELGILKVGRFTDYTNQFVDAPQENIHFLLNKNGITFSYHDLSPEEGVSLENIFREIFLANDRDAYSFAMNGRNRGQTFDQYVAGALRDTSLEHLALAFTYLNGRTFKRVIDGPAERLTRRTYLALLSRPGLESMIPEPQIPRGAPPVLLNPFDEQPDRELQDYKSDLREALLAPLFRSRPDTGNFFSRLNSLTPEQKKLLLEDNVFLALLRGRFNGIILWIAFSTLDSANQLHEPHVQINLALLHRDARMLTDMLSVAVLIHHDDLYYSMLREVILVIFSHDAVLPEMLHVIDHRNDPGVSHRFKGDYKEVHYEEFTNGHYRLERFTGHQAAFGYFSGSDLRVIVRIRFVNGDDSATCPTAESNDCLPFMFGSSHSSKYDQWKTAITDRWNDKFTITNGIITRNIKFVPYFVAEDGEQVANVRIMTDNSKTCQAGSEPGRANETCWFINKMDEDEKGTVVHEFGHIIGATDEYNLPGSYQEIQDAIAAGRADLTGLNAEDNRLTTMEGITGRPKDPHPSGQGHDINSLMGNHYNSTEVHTRHLTRLMRLLNAGLAPGTPPFEVHRR